MDFSSFL